MTGSFEEQMKSWSSGGHGELEMSLDVAPGPTGLSFFTRPGNVHGKLNRLMRGSDGKWY